MKENTLVEKYREALRMLRDEECPYDETVTPEECHRRSCDVCWREYAGELLEETE
jgi:hypothetical protein